MSRPARAKIHTSFVLALEYLPLTYSRRHGDPSRPWNAFSIQVRHQDGRPFLYYQGNWRDIFQNWEALLFSFPGFLPHVIAKFVNASTLDGFNPYRITRDGIDWETPDPEDPWSHIGYWGDHQIVYLTRLLEAAESFWPGTLSEWMCAPIFSYADVPYRLKGHEAIVEDPRNTIIFDPKREKLVEQRVAKTGADGRLVTTKDGAVYCATLAEKLIVPVLAKLGQLVLDGGIWMNTQRPEWNDANNALAGYGLSMVTLYQLRRHLALLERLFDARAQTAMSTQVSAWLDEVVLILGRAQPLMGEASISAKTARGILDALGRASESYRNKIYAQSPTPGSPRPLRDLGQLCRLALPVLDHAIRTNRRSDGLYHAYNLLSIEPESAQIETMCEMLEGQVAVLSAGVLSPQEAAELLDALFKSALYREDQRSFMLYPERPLASFLEKNIIAPEHLSQDTLLEALLGAGPRRDRGARLQGPCSVLRRLQKRGRSEPGAGPPRQGARLGQRGADGARGDAGDLRADLQAPRVYRTIRNDVWIRGPGKHLLAHGLQAIALGAREPALGPRWRRASRGDRAPPRAVRARARRPGPRQAAP